MKSKKSFKVFQIIFLITLFIAAMALGALSGAYYKSSRKGEGTVVFNKGLYYSIYNLSVDSAGTMISEGNILYYTDGTTANNYAGFKDISIGQTEIYQVATPFIKTESNTLPFYVRAKLEYVMYTESSGTYTKITNAKAITNLKTQLFTNGVELEFDSASWIKNNGGWFYYVDSSKNLKVIDSSITSDIKLFTSATAPNGKNYYSTLKTGEWDTLKGGPEATIDGTTYKLAKLDINLTIESIQAEGVETWNYDPSANTSNAVVDNTNIILKDSSGNQVDLTNDLVLNSTYSLLDAANNGFQFTYCLNEGDKSAKITGVVGEPTELIIPNNIVVGEQKYKIISIEDFAFVGCESLTTVSIPGSVKTIGEGAFASCTAITSLTFEEGVTTIKIQAFYALENLKSIALPKSITRIEPNAFGSCNSLEKLNINNQNLMYFSVNNCIVEKANNYIIVGCNTSIIPSDGSATGIDNFAFYGLNIDSIIIPSSINEIKKDAFLYCSNLKTIIGPGWVKASDNSDMPSGTTLWKLSDDIKRK